MSTNTDRDRLRRIANLEADRRRAEAERNRLYKEMSLVSKRIVYLTSRIHDEERNQ